MKFDYELKYELKERLFYSWYTPIMICYENITRIIQYVPLLWKDRDWDHAFLMRMLAFKLSRMAKHHKNDSYHVCSDRMAKQLQICAHLAKRISMCEYCEKETEDHYEQYPCDGDFFSNMKKTRSTQEWKDFKRLMDKEVYLRNYDKELLFKLIRKHMDDWWC